ncbi:hypothetical protein COW94_00215 [Candidatus Peregrinibacteria bacterium CG22_combo_CG10-13_8_21_14_all_44_10]|nr:MAG: hypothetical protein AUK45_02065 [Candidatus Peregrinibacteria bacterium CG2_30_44_17]PIP66731.1 MAG: hypothetical protein COW94_00215 [Candidatus Peregrinibacteria bacterium CG22_combo_CG10-13_8_21_14_all_44_10]PIS04060.1 MAG: hypothetical protein COT83_02655 [Candidatus Peregrinibacteria bacterium CG10_big_fil_rev_8_21_14_0_10_44_7]PIX79116.1 MAG: hypothetical protein COZ35_04040 [Candidatus Peregrinibacteria bacterium CG_4_10_14_3_um_filter_44_21]PJB88914.1 MAG: hypothetical protein 
MDKIKNKIETILSLVLLAGLGIFGFLRVTAYLDLYNYNIDLAASTIEVESSVNAIATELTEAKLVFQDSNSAKNEEIAGVFPDNEDITSLTRAFDEFSVANNFSNNPFFISSINYNDSDESDDGKYMVLPFTMKASSSENNFYKFLEYIETSGNLDNQVRLMGVDGISINLATDDDVLSYSLELNAYFQK